MPKTLTVEDNEIRILQIALQGANANNPGHPGLDTLTPKVAALSDAPAPAAAPAKAG